MGRDKATLVYAGETLATRAARKLAAVTDTVLIADRGRGTAPGYPSIEDGPGVGPAAGILGAAARHPNASLLVLACDLPHVPLELLRALVSLDPGADLIVPRSSQGLEPLCALYRPRALAALATCVEAGEMALHPLAGREGLRVMVWEVGEEFGEAAFVNWNRGGDVGARG